MYGHICKVVWFLKSLVVTTFLLFFRIGWDSTTKLNRFFRIINFRGRIGTEFPGKCGSAFVCNTTDYQPAKVRKNQFFGVLGLWGSE